MDKKGLKIGFIGVGFMGYGMALNLIKQKLDLTIIAHKNRVPIDKLIQKGAKEVDDIQELAKKCNVIYPKRRGVLSNTKKNKVSKARISCH